MDINHLAIDIKTWADRAFPHRTDESMFLKLYGEIAEMIDAGDDCGDEVADVLILVLDYARRKGVNPSEVTQAKLRINEKREWTKTPIGTYQHVEPEQIQPHASCVQQQLGDRNRNATPSCQAVAHDRDNPNPDSCRAHGQCRAPVLANCSQFPKHVVLATRMFADCNGPRPGGSIYRGYPDPQQEANRIGNNQQGGGVDTTTNLFDDGTLDSRN